MNPNPFERFVHRATQYTFIITASLVAVTALADLAYYYLLSLRGRNVSDVGIPMYEYGGKVVGLWFIGFPILCLALNYIIRKAIRPHYNLPDWVIGLIGLQFWLWYALALGV